ncbi:MAG: exodeoxyribonuclease VII small subunit [Firmicutes bacterium]|nr:exodeoxyribonuclease VII small subunit [Bacillota bacterium]
MSEKKIEDLTFEEALAALEETAESLRSGKLGLEESVEVYDKSILLYNRCKGILDKAKQKIEIYRPQDGTTEAFEE